jgi:hypothetical protein
VHTEGAAVVDEAQFPELIEKLNIKSIRLQLIFSNFPFAGDNHGGIEHS